MSSVSGRIVWMAVGAVAGVVATQRAKRVAYRFSMPGLIDQTEAVVAGLREFNNELRHGMAEKERQFRLQALVGPEPQLPADTPLIDLSQSRELTKDPT